VTLRLRVRPRHAFDLLMIRILFIALSAVVLLSIPRATAWANMAEPPEPYTLRPGSSVGEPAGGLRGVVIEHEALRLDLRPLARGNPVLVDAAYRVRNDGPARAIDLLFVANGLARGATSVTVDGRPVASTPGTAGALPPSWRSPASTPGFDSAGATLPYAPRGEGTLSFRVHLPAGRHEIRVRYPAEATVYSVNELTPVWQLGYVLAPAREWGGFGGMEVRVEVPRGWRVRTEPALRREGDALVGAWNRVPADALAISAQKPAPASGPWYWLWLALTAAGLAVIGLMGWRRGAALGRRGKSAWWTLPVSVGLALAWTVLASILYANVPALVRWQTGPFPGEYPLRSLRYGSTIALLLLIPLMLFVGLAVAQTCALVAHRRAETRA